MQALPTMNLVESSPSHRNALFTVLPDINMKKLGVHILTFKPLNKRYLIDSLLNKHSPPLCQFYNLRS